MNIKLYRAFIFSFLLFCIFSCRPKHEIERGMYYWKSFYKISDYEKNMLDSLGVTKLYIKFFDVTWNEELKQVLPVAKFISNDSIDLTRKIVPVVYITNESILKTDVKNIPELAGKISSLINKISGKLSIPFQEIQFDCDWTDASKERYFLLLKTIRKTYGKNIKFSATIRLHQVKYFKRTGIPPVDRGMIMCYNMGKIEDMNSVNSIFNEGDAVKYTDFISEYPLASDVALPIFSWGVVFKNGKIHAIMDFITPEELLKEGFITNDQKIYTPPKPMYFRGHYFAEGDKIKLEEVTPALSRIAADMVAKEMTQGAFGVTLYHMDSVYLKKYGKEELNNLYSSFE